MKPNNYIRLLFKNKNTVYILIYLIFFSCSSKFSHSWIIFTNLFPSQLKKINRDLLMNLVKFHFIQNSLEWNIFTKNRITIYIDRNSVVFLATCYEIKIFIQKSKTFFKENHPFIIIWSTRR